MDEISAVSRILGECLGAVFSTVADDIVARIDAQDGCRLVQFATKFPISKLKQAKQFEVNLGSMYGDEDRTVLFRVSLRNMKVRGAVIVLFCILTCVYNNLLWRRFQWKLIHY